MEEHGKHDAANESNDKRNCIYLFIHGSRVSGRDSRQNREQVKTIVIRADTPVTHEEGKVL